MPVSPLILGAAVRWISALLVCFDSMHAVGEDHKELVRVHAA